MKEHFLRFAVGLLVLVVFFSAICGFACLLKYSPIVTTGAFLLFSAYLIGMAWRK